jgi:hypothetical protein
MIFLPPTCFECGDTGHVKADCPNLAYVDGTASGWCGTCDERTRHVELADSRVKRCSCHPAHRHALAQHRRCPSCHLTIVTWDSAQDCVHHILGGIPRQYAGPAVREITPDEDALRALAAAQAAASRAARPLL